MLTLAILADDLTGANDTGVQLARQGLATSLSPFWREPLEPLDAKATVWVFNTESRHVPPDEAARRVAAVTALARRCGAKVLYKKTDSVLRGPLGAELEAARQAWNEGPLIYVPAFPATGRIVRDGALFLNGVPLAETDFARDPLAPIRTSLVNEVLRATAPVVPETVSLAALRRGEADFTTPGRLLIVEGETDADLAQTAALAARSGPPTCWAGPAAFAFYLPALFAIPTGTPAPVPCQPPFLLINGSMHMASVHQKNRAIESGYLDVEVNDQTFAQGGLAARAIAALRAGQSVALYHFRDETEDAHKINTRLVQTARQILDAVLPGTLVLFGGETSQTVLRETGAVHCRILKQIDWGVVLMEACTPHGTFNIITKSGGFGPPDLLERISL